MDPTQLIPYPDALPAPWWVFYVLMVVTFSLHLILANVMIGAGALAWFNSVRGEASPLAKSGLGGELAGKIPWVIALTINLGIAPLLFMQVVYGQYIYVSSVVMAAYWVPIFLLIVAAYYLAYVFDMRYDKLGRKRIWVQGFSVGIFMVVGILFSAIIVMMINPQYWMGYFAKPHGTLFPLGDSSLGPRMLHFLLASMAIGGLAVALWANWRLKDDPQRAEPVIRQGLYWFGVATMANFIAGVLYLGALPDDVLYKVLGTGKLATYFLLVGVVAGLASIPSAFAGSLKLTTIYCLVSVLLMVFFRYAVRAAYLEPYLDKSKLPLATQYGPMFIFLIVFALGLATVGYLIKLALKAGKEVKA